MTTSPQSGTNAAYFAHRAEQERARAAAATDLATRRVHEELARRYTERAGSAAAA